MKIIRALTSLGTAVAFVALPIAAQQPSSLQQDRQVVIPARPSWERVPTPETVNVPLTGQQKQLRQNRSDSFNHRLGLAPKLEDAAQAGGGVGATTDHGFIPPLPVNSPAIIVGKVISAQSHLSSDHTTIYTELKVQIEKILQDTSANLVPQGSLDILETGGAVTINGRSLHYPVSNSSGLVDVGKRYVLFLHTKPPGLGAFGITKAWLLDQGHPQPTRAYRPSDQENVGRYMAMTEPEFISHVEQAIEEHNIR
jgi:hypothetical protein